MGWPRGVPRKPPEEPIDLGPITRHGTASGYQKGCRCAACRQAINDVHDRTRRRKAGEDIPYQRPEPVGRTHGLRSTYVHGCDAGPDGGPCADCKRAEAEYRRDYRRRQRYANRYQRK